MGLGIGIVGLPNVGKSTLFNALTHAQNADSANYPFCTIEPNKAIVTVPDPRLDKLALLSNSKIKINATVEFVDIAGLVRGASKGEGLGNKFLANIRETNSILHVIRCFDDDQVVHVDGSVDPLRDIEIIETELIMSDYQAIENRLPRLIKAARGDKSIEPVIEWLDKLLKHLGSGKMVNCYEDRESNLALSILSENKFLTDKPIIYCCNVSEEHLSGNHKYVDSVESHAANRGAEVIRVCSKMEEDLNGLEPEEKSEFLSEYGINSSGLEKIIQTGYKTLGLISYFTQGPKESRAWTIASGCLAPQAAGVIHSDFERGFIRAQVMSYQDFIDKNGELGCREAGLLRTEGRDYVVSDGDIIEFLFNV